MQGYAVKAGMLCARGELLLMADADGATVAAEEQRLEEAMQQIKVSPAMPSIVQQPSPCRHEAGPDADRRCLSLTLSVPCSNGTPCCS